MSRHFPHVGMDPKTAPLLKEMQSEDGAPRVCEHVWISSIGNDGSQDEHHGKLTTGFGAMGRGEKIGPEFTFRDLHATACRSTHIDHQDRLGRQVAAHRFPSAQRRAL